MKILLCFLLLIYPFVSRSAEVTHEAGANPIENNITNKYVQSWYKFPIIAGKKVGTPEKLTFRPQQGYATVAIFLASWCIPCQVLIRNFQEMEKKYANRHTTFVYIFAHDTESDAKGFIDAYKITGHSILASVELMNEFHQPSLPSIYLADRHGWLTWRQLSAEQNDLLSLDKFLEVHTAW